MYASFSLNLTFKFLASACVSEANTIQIWDLLAPAAEGARLLRCTRLLAYRACMIAQQYSAGINSQIQHHISQLCCATCLNPHRRSCQRFVRRYKG